MNLHITNETVFIHQLNKGDVQAFELVFHKYYASLCFFANKFIRDEEAAKDVVQEVFIRFYEKEVNFPNLLALKSFLFSCVQNKALNYLEKNNIRTAIRKKLTQPESEETEYFHYQVEAEIFEQIFATIEELPTECRRIFKMSYIEHLDIPEIMQRLNIAESTIKTQRQRAKKFLRERLQHLYPLMTFLLF